MLLIDIAGEYPQHLRTAVEHMLNDQGQDMVEAEDIDLPTSFDDNVLIDWQRVNKFLGMLDDESMEAFCVGDQEEMVTIAHRHGAEGAYAHTALDQLYMHLGT